MKKIYIQKLAESWNQEAVLRDLKINVSQRYKLKEWITGDETEHLCLPCFAYFYQVEYMGNINQKKNYSRVYIFPKNMSFLLILIFGQN